MVTHTHTTTTIILAVRMRNVRVKVVTKLKTTKIKFIGLLEDFTKIVSPENYRLYGITLAVRMRTEG